MDGGALRVVMLMSNARTCFSVDFPFPRRSWVRERGNSIRAKSRTIELGEYIWRRCMNTGMDGERVFLVEKPRGMLCR